MENTENSVSELEQYLSFTLGAEYYAINILRVQEIKGWTKPTPIPNSAEYVKGVINLRGTVVPIIDLRAKFNMEFSDYDKKTVVIVTKVKNKDSEKIVGIVVDSVADTQDIPNESIENAPELGSQINTDFIKGISNVNEQMLIILDIDKLINIGVLDTQVSLEENE